MHACGLAGGEVVVALHVQEAVEGVEKEFVVEGVVELFGAAGGFAVAEDGVEVQRIFDLRFEI